MPSQLKTSLLILLVTPLVLAYQNCAVYKNNDRKELEEQGYGSPAAASLAAKLRANDCQTLREAEQLAHLFIGAAEIRFVAAESERMDQARCVITSQAQGALPILCTITEIDSHSEPNEASVSCRLIAETDESLAEKNSYADFVIALDDAIAERLDQ